MIVLALYWSYRKYQLTEESQREELDEARRRAAAATSEASPAWEVANVNLEAYFKRNLQQVNHVFWVSVAVMVAGFGCVIAGVYVSFNDPSHVTPPAKVAAISGVITQFWGDIHGYLPVDNGAGQSVCGCARSN